MIGMIFYAKGPANYGANMTTRPLVGSHIGGSGASLENAEKILSLFSREA
jgi:hypothetical protein